MGIIAWIIVGLIAGWGAGKVMKGGGYGVVMDIVLGILGGLFGGWLFGMLGIWRGGGVIGSIIVAFIGAVILIWITRLIKKGVTIPAGRDRSRSISTAIEPVSRAALGRAAPNGTSVPPLRGGRHRRHSPVHDSSRVVE